MAHNSAHYSLVNVGLGFMQCYDGSVWTIPLSDGPPRPTRSLGTLRWQSLIFSWKVLLPIYVILQTNLPNVILTRHSLLSESHHGPTLAFSRYKELLGHKSREQIEMSLYTCSVSGRPLFIIFMVSNTNQDWRQRQETACHYWHVSCLPAR